MAGRRRQVTHSGILAQATHQYQPEIHGGMQEGTVGVQTIDVTQLGAFPASERPQVVDAGNPVGFYRRFLVLGILAAIASEFDHEVT